MQGRSGDCKHNSLNQGRLLAGAKSCRRDFCRGRLLAKGSALDCSRALKYLSHFTSWAPLLLGVARSYEEGEGRVCVCLGEVVSRGRCCAQLPPHNLTLPHTCQQVPAPVRLSIRAPSPLTFPASVSPPPKFPLPVCPSRTPGQLVGDLVLPHKGGVEAEGHAAGQHHHRHRCGGHGVGVVDVQLRHTFRALVALGPVDAREELRVPAGVWTGEYVGLECGHTCVDAFAYNTHHVLQTRTPSAQNQPPAIPLAMTYFH